MPVVASVRHDGGTRVTAATGVVRANWGRVACIRLQVVGRPSAHPHHLRERCGQRARFRKCSAVADHEVGTSDTSRRFQLDVCARCSL